MRNGRKFQLVDASKLKFDAIQSCLSHIKSSLRTNCSIWSLKGLCIIIAQNDHVNYDFMQIHLTIFGMFFETRNSKMDSWRDFVSVEQTFNAIK